MTNQIAVQGGKTTPLMAMAARLEVSPEELEGIVKQTVMPSKQTVSNEQFLAFLAVANSYKLDPLKKEIYAYPSKGGIQPTVSIDGWISIIVSNPAFDGMKHTERFDENGDIFSVTCTISRKDHNHPTEVTEYFNECKRNTDNWRNMPIRMLRHRATIQCARYAFGLSGIMEQDEAEEMASKVNQKDITPEPQPDFYPADRFAELFPTWEAAIQSGKQTAENIIGWVESKGNPLTEEQKKAIYGVTQLIEGEIQ